MTPSITVEFLDAIREKYNLDSDGKAAKLLGVSRQRMSNYRNGHDTLGEEIALKAAELLELPQGYVLSCIQAERSKRPQVRDAWEKIAKSLAASLAAAFLGVSALATPTPSQAAPVSEINPDIHYAKRRRRPRKAPNPLGEAREAARTMLDLIPRPKSPLLA